MTTVSEQQWLNEVLKADPDHYKTDPAYEFDYDSTDKVYKRIFNSTDNTDSGIYSGS